ncbi:hypothetical protein RJ641_034380 [Dillenia turbinata]|uniref:Uncharacterized protein n=1 Tax=Dillenia turbinata TaxID=194707 RepID=A0AAN8VHB6_9MAGN
MWKPKNYGTSSGAAVVATKIHTTAQSKQNGATTVVAGNSTATLSSAFSLSDFNFGNSTYSLAQIRATLHPKFENERSDQEVRTRMIEMVSKGLAALEVSLKHSGSLFMYAGNDGGAYAKNNFGNMFWEAWTVEATKKQAEFNDFLEEVASANKSCVVVLDQANKERASEIATDTSNLAKTVNGSDAIAGLDGLADEDANLTIKLKFLTYKEGPAAYRSYYLSPENQALVGSAGNRVRAEDFLAIVEGGRDEEGDLEPEREVAPSSPNHSTKDTVPKAEGLIIFFPGRILRSNKT